MNKSKEIILTNFPIFENDSANSPEPSYVLSSIRTDMTNLLVAGESPPHSPISYFSPGLSSLSSMTGFLSVFNFNFLAASKFWSDLEKQGEMFKSYKKVMRKCEVKKLQKFTLARLTISSSSSFFFFFFRKISVEPNDLSKEELNSRHVFHMMR